MWPWVAKSLHITAVDKGVVGTYREFQYHLINLGIAVVPARDNTVSAAIEHPGPQRRVMPVGQAVPGPEVKQIPQKDDSIAAKRIRPFHKRLCRVSRDVYNQSKVKVS